MRPEISGDVPLSITDRLRYLWRNGVRNLSSLGRGPRTRPFRHFTDGLPAIAGQSPGRYLTEQFLAAELPRMLPPSQPVNVVEIGCGSGSMALRLEGLGYSGRYVGVDIDDRFRHAVGSLTRTFICGDAHDFAPQNPIDLLISVSALEHIPRDADLIRRLSTHIRKGGLELHFVPARAGLLVYLWHGYRQYSPLDLVQRFGPGVQIAGLGGLACLALHFLVITPEVFFGRFARTRFPRLYANLMRAALVVDRVMPICPTAYAVVRCH